MELYKDNKNFYLYFLEKDIIYIIILELNVKDKVLVINVKKKQSKKYSKYLIIKKGAFQSI